MDTMSIISALLSITEAIAQQAEKVQANLQKCTTLANRIKALGPSIKRKLYPSASSSFDENVAELGTLGNDNINPAMLNSLLSCFQDAEKLLVLFTSNWYMQFMKSGTSQELFLEISDRLRKHCLELHLEISIEQVFNRDQDKQDEEKDRILMESKLEGFLSMNHKELEKSLKLPPTTPENLQDELRSARNKVRSRVKDLTAVSIPPSDVTKGKELGFGAFGRVYMGTYQGAPVALKELVSNLEEEAYENFIREISIMRYASMTKLLLTFMCSTLKYPNIVNFYGAVITSTQKMIVMELMNVSLYTYLRQQHPIDASLRLKIAMDIACGMYHLVTRNPPIHHRDLKSHNVLLDGLLNVKLTDFGLAKLKTFSKSLSRVGTTQWTAPEVLNSDSVDIDYEKADVYSFGVVLWELETRKTPWEGMDPLKVLDIVVYKKRKLELPSSADPFFCQTMVNCWQDDPKLRNSFKELAETFGDKYANISGGPMHLVGENRPAVRTATSNIPTTPQQAPNAVPQVPKQSSPNISLQIQREPIQLKKPTLLDLDDSKIRILKGHTFSVYCLAIDGNNIISGSGDSTIRVWDKTTGNSKELNGHTNAVYCLVVDGNDIISGSADKSIRIWHKITGASRKLEVHTGTVRCLAIDGNNIISGSDDNTIRVSDKAKGTSREMKGHANAVYCLAVDANSIISGSCDNTIRIWDKATGNSRVLKGHTGSVNCLAIDGNNIISGSYDKTIRIWDKTTGNSRELKGHTCPVYCLAIDDNNIVSGSLDNIIRIWDKKTGNSRALMGHNNAVYCIAIDGNNIISGSWDTTIRIWG